MAWFIVILLVATATAAFVLFLRKKQNKSCRFFAFGGPNDTLREPTDQSTPRISLPDVSIVYEDAAGARTEREITPLHRLGSRTVTAFCHLHNDERTFLVDRIRMVRDSGSGEVLEKHLWVETLPKVESQTSRFDRNTEYIIRVTADIQQDGVRISVDGSSASASESSAEDHQKNAEA